MIVEDQGEAWAPLAALLGNAGCGRGAHRGVVGTRSGDGRAVLGEEVVRGMSQGTVVQDLGTGLCGH